MEYYISKPDRVIQGVCVYAHRKASDNSVFYIGQGVRDRAWTRFNRNAIWHNIEAKHGVLVEILRDNLTRAQANEEETALIKLYGRRVDGSGVLANIVEGGGGIQGWHHTDETKERIGAASRGKKQSDELIAKRTAHRKGIPMSTKAKEALRTYWSDPDNRAKQRQAKLGTTLTAEARAKISVAHKGRKLPEHRVEAMRIAAAGENNPMYGKTHTPEAREKIAAARRGKPLSDEHKRKIDPTGRKHSEDAKRKIGDAHRGRALSTEQCAKMSATIRAKRGLAVRCIETDHTFQSLIEAVEWVQVTRGNPKAQGQGIRKAIQTGGIAYGYHWELPPRLICLTTLRSEGTLTPHE